MKTKIHPEYGEILVRCVSCKTEFTTRSTRLDLPKHEYQGRSLPTMSLEICSNCHPFYSGKQTIVDTAGRVEKFMRRYGKKPAAAADEKKPEGSQ
jgi:large subunit ribosomal protein L31